MRKKLGPWGRLKRFLRRYEFVRTSILPVYRKARYIRLRVAQELQLRLRTSTMPPPEQRYWLSPERIVLHTNFEPDRRPRIDDRVFDTNRDRGKVYGGNWDLSLHHFEDLKVFKAFKSRIKDGMEWAETDFYQELLADIEKGFVIFNCTSKYELDLHFSYLDSLIASIRERGYVENYKVILDEEKGKPPKNKHLSDEIMVNISRNGKYLFQDGRHRMAVAKLLGVPSIPFQVLVRHREWVRFREELLMYAQEAGGKLYQPAIHPDLMDIPAAHGCINRFNAMRDNLELPGGTIIDIGANLGYFCHKFEELGFHCMAVEYDPILFKYADKIRRAENRHFELIKGDILDRKLWARIGPRFDVVLLLNVLHHFLKTKESFDAMTRMLNKLESQIIFFEPHLPSEKQMVSAYLNYGPEEFIQYILENTGKKQSRPILTTEDGRTLFMLT